MLGKTAEIILIAFFLLVSSVANTRAENDMTEEYLVKAAFLYNFAKFVEWPDNAFTASSSPIKLFILGDNPFGETIESIRGKVVRGRKLVIKHISRTENLDGCHILFICSSEKDRLIQVLDIMKDSNVLTVGDMEDFARRGGIVELVNAGNKVKFKVNVGAAQKAGLKISSKLLKLAKIVKNNQGQE